MQDTSQSDLNQYTVNIKGQQFSVSSRYAEEEIRRVETFLLKQIDEIAAKSDTYNLMSLITLVALNLSDEVLHSKNRAGFSDHVRESLIAMCDRLDSVVQKKETEQISAE
ncbi:MAG: cell division protein ZapA [SAR324 cluster bacterium]|nr:cell division protein ZapA [SAR324 cluster bacterium]